MYIYEEGRVMSSQQHQHLQGYPD